MNARPSGSHAASGEPQPIAVIDVGSNSLRMMIARPRSDGYLEVVAEPRATVRLARAVDASGGLSAEAIGRTLTVLDDFMALAGRWGATRVGAVGTAALRDAGNASDLEAAIKDRWGIELELLDGATEGRRAALGAIYGLPVERGLVVDLGGGSLQIARFEDRAIGETWSFRLGTLRLTDRFFSSDPPAAGEIEALRLHVRAEFVSAGVPRLGPGEVLVGTGGAVRNLAAVSRRGRRYPIVRVHGYTLTSRRLRRVRNRLASLKPSQRRVTPGLNRDRSDIIVAGASALLATAEHVRGRSLLVSGQGLREGVARGDGPLPDPSMVRRASVDALVRRFASWDEDRARRRAAIVEVLVELLDREADEALRETLAYAAKLYDIGGSVDAYRRQRAAADIVLSADLSGFEHASTARLAALIRVAHRPQTAARALRPLLGPEDDDALQRGGAILVLADALELRLPPGVPPQAELSGGAGELRVLLPGRSGWRPERLAARIEQVFGQRLMIEDERGELSDAGGG